MTRILLSLLALLLVATVPVLALAGDEDDSEEEDEGEEAPGIPPWIGDDDDDDKGDDDDDDASKGETGETTPAPAPEPKPKVERRPVRTTTHYAGLEGLDPSDLRTLKGGGPVGIGVVAGTINGLGMKFWLARPHAITFDLGAHPSVLNALVVRLGYRIHIKPVIVAGSPVSLHFNLGPAFRTRMVFFSNGTYIEMAGGVGIGIAATLAKVPAEIFAEVAPVYGGGVSPAGGGLGFSVDGLVGLRIFLGK